MRRYTAVVYDKDADTSYVVRCSAETVGNIEGLVQRYLFNKAVEAGDTDWDTIEYDEDNITDDIVDLEVMAVFEGDQEDLATVKLEEINIPEGWLITVPPKEDDEDEDDSKDE